jgi:hypothetical protein
MAKTMYACGGMIYLIIAISSVAFCAPNVAHVIYTSVGEFSY